MRRPSADPVGTVGRAIRVGRVAAPAVPHVSAAPSEVVQEVPVEADEPTSDGWQTVVWNDPVNLMSYVTYVFRSYFGYSEERANRLMLQVHEAGRATVSRGNREQMEIDVQAMHGFGLWATLQAAGE